MLVSFIRWLKGYLIVQLIGYSPERFLNLCKNKNIVVWNISSVNNTYEICVHSQNYFQLKPICKKTGVKVKIIKRCGFPFCLKRLKYRKTFVAGLLFLTLFLFCASNFIWKFQIDGNHVITEDVMSSYLNDKKIKIGSLKKNINCKELSDSIRDAFDNIVWTSVSINGTELCIAIKEKKDSSIIDSNENHEIIATHPGRVVKMITRSGTPFVKVGDEVGEGDILVIGDADIWIESEIPYCEEVLATYSYKQYENNWNYSRKKERNSLEETFIEFIFGFELCKRRSYQWKFDSYEENEREQILNDRLKQFCTKLEDKNANVISTNVITTHYINKSISKGTIRLIYLHKIWYN